MSSTQFGYEFNESITPSSLLGDMASISPGAVVQGFFSASLVGLINMAMLLSVTAIIVVETVQQRRRSIVVLAITALSIPLGVLAFLSILSSLSAGLDGEWLSEGWPIIESFFFWSVALCVYSLPELAKVRAASNASQLSLQLEGSQR